MIKVNVVLSGSSVTRWTCDVCGDVFTRNSSLKRHVQSKHSSQPPQFPCSQCSKTFKLQRSLDEHFAANHDQRLFTCAFCGRKYGTAMGLRNHESEHTGNYLYSCSKCRYKTNYKPDFEAHGATKHAEPAMFECGGCKKHFKHKTNLSRHKKTCKKLKPPDSHNKRSFGKMPK